MHKALDTAVSGGCMQLVQLPFQLLNVDGSPSWPHSETRLHTPCLQFHGATDNPSHVTARSRICG